LDHRLFSHAPQELQDLRQLDMEALGMGLLGMAPAMGADTALDMVVDMEVDTEDRMEVLTAGTVVDMAVDMAVGMAVGMEEWEERTDAGSDMEPWDLLETMRLFSLLR
jgi:hypothetical protein